jgi:translation initiation factor 2B subunit (eIF-2B alpha/beta/delta family)
VDVKHKLPLIFGVPDKKFIERFSGREAFVAELRPGIEGIKVTAAVLQKKGVAPVLICDNMMAFCMQRGLVERVFIFAQSVGPATAVCRTGSLVAALCAKIHGIPVECNRTRPLKKKASSLLKMDGRSVTSARIKTWVPLTEEVPLELITEIKYG